MLLLHRLGGRALCCLRVLRRRLLGILRVLVAVLPPLLLWRLGVALLRLGRGAIAATAI